MGTNNVRNTKAGTTWLGWLRLTVMGWKCASIYTGRVTVDLHMYEAGDQVGVGIRLL